MLRYLGARRACPPVYDPWCWKLGHSLPVIRWSFGLLSGSTGCRGGKEKAGSQLHRLPHPLASHSGAPPSHRAHTSSKSKHNRGWQPGPGGLLPSLCPSELQPIRFSWAGHHENFLKLMKTDLKWFPHGARCVPSADKEGFFL